ncbi:hypothetical protein Z965_05120 [Clostridium novyi A str. BKT29909]|nr:hypothetical protein [Clostridium novyi]KEH87948.1 hypothetical protein Z965_05120 [Clostridium novyi A str. BKT29909]
MNRCIILGNKFEMRQAKICELMDEMGCSKVELKGEVEEFSKVMLMYSDILYGIEGEEIQLIKNPGIYSILDKDKLVAISSKISIHGQVYEISIFEKSYGEGNDIKTIEVELNAEHEIDGFDENFYDIKIKIKECIKDYYKEVYFIEDTQNEKICIELYKLIYNNENKFRSLINKYMVITYGANWFQKVIDKSYKDSVLNLNRWYREQEGAEFKNINGELYNLLINDLIEMLQKSQIDGVSISDRNKYNELFQSLESKSNLKKILENIDINKETVWDRNFKRYIDENFEEMWNEYKNMRNMVAHNKLVCRTVKNRIVEHSKKISIKLSEISKCIEKIYKDNERMYVKKVYEQISEEFYLEEAGGIKLPNKEDVFLEIEEDYCYSNMINEVDEKLNKLKDKRDKVAWYIERVVEYYEDKNNMIEKSKLYNLFLDS